MLMAMSESVVLLQLRSVLMSIDHVMSHVLKYEGNYAEPTLSLNGPGIESPMTLQERAGPASRRRASPPHYTPILTPPSHLPTLALGKAGPRPLTAGREELAPPLT